MRVVVLIDGKNLALLLFRQAQHRLDAIKLGHILALVEEDFAVAIVDDTLLHNGRLNDVIHFLRHHNGFSKILAHRLVEILDVVRHISRSNGFPRFFDENHFANTFQSTHLVDKGFHNDDRHHREEVFVVLHLVNLKDNEAFRK